MNAIPIRSLSIWSLATALLLCGGCRRQPPVPAGAAVAPIEVHAPPGAVRRLDQLLRPDGPGLGRAGRRERINTLLPATPWAGRVRESDVSKQALFFVDDMSARLAPGRRDARRFAFSILPGSGSRLSFRVHLEAGNKRWLAFERKAAQPQSFSGHVDLDPAWKNLRVRLETRGRGIGAWINPRFIGNKEKPRVCVVIVIDSVRADHTSPGGYARDTTPAWAALGRDGRVFRRAFSTSSWTLPAHASLFSGCDLPGHRVQGPTDRLREDTPLLAEVFQKNGFTTAAFTGGGFVDDHFGFHRGFQVYSNNPGGVFLMDSAGRVLRHFKKFAEEHWGEDLFFFLHTYQAHAPYKFPSHYKPALNPALRSNLLGPTKFLGRDKAACFRELPPSVRQELIDLYDTAIFYADQALVAGVVDYLKAKGAYAEATLVVGSDHGEEFYDHGGWEHGRSLYREVLHIPLTIKFPQGRQRGVDDSLTSIADIPRLLVQDGGLEAPSVFASQAGGSAPRVLEAALPVSPIIREIPTKVAFIDDRFHFIYNAIDPQALAIFDPPPRSIQVYELYGREDGRQARNLVGAHPPGLKGFHERLAAYLRRQRSSSRGGDGALDEALLQELRSLGYLGD